MSFTYSLTTDIGLVRLEIGDTVSGTGVRPDGTNLSDEELQVWLTREGSVMRAAAAACEALARMWALASDISVGPRRESLSQVGARWAEQASALRAQYGGAATAFAAGWARTDGFSAEAGSTDYSQ